MAKKSLLYTKTGDKGETSLFGGQRVKKASLRIHTLGTIDELNAALGVAGSQIKRKKVRDLIEKIQNELFNLGAEIANPKKISTPTQGLITIKESNVKFLEHSIDNIDSSLPTLTNFILPAGAKGASQLHLSRAVCRRAERYLTQLATQESINPFALHYLNRLSDLLFALARDENQASGVKDKPWSKD